MGHPQFRLQSHLLAHLQQRMSIHEPRHLLEANGSQAHYRGGGFHTLATLMHHQADFQRVCRELRYQTLQSLQGLNHR